MLSNIKVVIFATDHLRCTLTALNLLADLQQRVVGRWRSNLAAVRSQVQSGAKSKKNKHSNNHDSERKLIAELLGRLFDDMHADDLRAVGEQQSSLLRELRKVKSELEEKLTSHNKRRGRCNSLYKMAFFAVLAGSVALAAAAAPAWAMTVATVVSTAMKAAEPWFDALWDDRKAALEGEKDVIKVMVRDVSAQLRERDRVRARANELKGEVGSLIGRGGNAGSFFFGLKMKEEYALAFEEVDKGIEALGETADGIQGDMKKAAADFVRMIADET
uniref:Uncharacterized protein n=1 Tax=Ananas comosus var. bracteatus TaxID=296719 RepID=A0A6V7PCA4_ANACO|nr:unnamed protein product [Ananas comosus var. bracteatus]